MGSIGWPMLRIPFLASTADDLLVSWMADPRGRLLLLLGFLGLLLVSLLLILVPLLRRSTTLLLRRLSESVERMRLGGPPGKIAEETSVEARALVEGLEALRGVWAEKIRSLEEDRRRLEGILDAPGDTGTLAADSGGHLRFVSRAASALLGYSPGDLVGRSVEILFPEEAWNELVPRLARRSFRESGLSVQTEMLRRDRTRMRAHLTVAPSQVSGEGGQFVAMFRDAAEEAAREDRVRLSDARLKGLMEAIQDGILILRNGRILRSNAAAQTLLGRPDSELAEKEFKETFASEDLLVILDRAEKALSEGGPEELVARVVPSPGSAHAREMRVRLSRIEAQTLLVILRDESKDRHSREEIEAGRTLLDATLDSTSDGILVHEISRGQSVPILVNRTLETLLGVSGAGILSWTHERLLTELAARGASEEEVQSLATAMSQSAGGSAVLDLATPTQRSLEITCSPLRIPGRETTGRVLAFRDITRRRESEQALRQGNEALASSEKLLQQAVADLESARRDLATRNEQLEKMNRDLRSVDEMKSSLLANVSHELQTPLVLIKGYTEMILKRKIGPLTPEQEKGLSVALKNIDRLVEMIDNLLDFSRMERGDSPLDLEEFPLWQVVDEVVELVREKLRARALSLETEYETDDLMVRADRGKISQVFINLLSNAIKFNRERGEIHVRVTAGESGTLDVEVRDTGIGIPPEEQEKIFDRFYQVDGSPGRQAEGTGIGLSIVRDILSLHGSSIRVESRPGEGSRFYFSLPKGKAASSSRPGPRSKGNLAQGQARKR